MDPEAHRPDRLAGDAADEPALGVDDVFQWAFEHSVVPKSITRPSGLAMVNEAFCAMLGYTREELGDGTNWAGLTHPDDVAETRRQMDALATGEQSVAHYEKRYLRKDGSAVWAEVHSSLRRDPDGRPLYFATTVFDVTERKRVAAELELTAATLQTAMDNSPLGIAIADAPDGKLRYVNDAGLLVRGGDRADLVNGIGIDAYVASWQILDLSGMPLKDDEVPLTRALMFGETNSREFLIRRAVGDDRLVDAHAAPIRDSEGKVVSGIVVFTDITDRRIEEHAAAEREARSAALLDNAPYGAHVYELHDDGRLVFTGYNRKAEEMLGVDHEQFMGKTLEEAFPGNAGTDTPEAYRRVAREGGTWETLQYAYDAEGIAGVFEVYAFSFGPGRVSVFFREITEKAKLEKAVREREELYRATFEHAAVGIAHVGLDGRWISVNDRLCKMLGYSREELLARSFADVTHPDDIEVNTHHLRRMVSGEESTYEAQKRYLRKDGSIVWVSLSAATIPDDNGDPDYIVSVFEDVTDRKVAEQMLQELAHSLEDRVAVRTRELDETVAQLTEANEAKTHFLRSMSHELRTPLNSVIGFSTMLADGIPGEINEEQERQLLMIKNSGQHLLSLINDILDLSRVEAGAVDFHIGPIDVSALVAEVAADCLPAALAKDLSLDVEPCDTKPMLTSDIRSVRQILLNLTGNAIKFTETGSVTLRCSVPAEGFVAISVADTGSGIAPEERERIFGEFERGAKANANVEGTGLGLAISLELATALGGNLELDSEVGIGSTFTVVLPQHREGSRG